MVVSQTHTHTPCNQSVYFSRTTYNKVHEEGRDSGRGSDGEDRSPTGVALPPTYFGVNCMQGCGLHHKRVRVDQT